MLTIEPSSAKPVAHADLPDSQGCYALVADPATMSELGLESRYSPAVLYVGKAVSQTVRARVLRTHFDKKNTGKSTLRRSIGALLLDELQLCPQPRSPKSSDSKRFTNYRFDCASELALSDWMIKRLGVIGIACSDPESAERRLIDRFRPPLNLTNLRGRKNPHRRAIMARRKRCAGLARTET